MLFCSYRKRKTEALQGKKLPEKLRRATVTFAEIARDALAYSKAHKRTYQDDVQRMERMLGWFRERSADSVAPQDIERHFEQCIEEEKWAPSTVNHYRSLLSLTYRLAIRDGKAAQSGACDAAPREDNSRVRYLTPEEETKLRAELEARWAGHIPEFDLAFNRLATIGNVRSGLAGCGPSPAACSHSAWEEWREPVCSPKLGRAQSSH